MNVADHQVLPMLMMTAGGAMKSIMAFLFDATFHRSLDDAAVNDVMSVVAEADSRFVMSLLVMNDVMTEFRAIQRLSNSAIMLVKVSFLLVAAEFPLMHWKSGKIVENLEIFIKTFSFILEITTF